MRNQIKELANGAREKYSVLSDEQFKNVLDTTNQLFNSQDPQYKDVNVYENILKVKAAEQLMANSSNISKDGILNQIKNSPELVGDLVKILVEDLGYVIPMPEGGFNDQSTFDSKIEEKKKEFRNAKDPEKRKRINKEIYNTLKEGEKFGYSIN